MKLLFILGAIAALVATFVFVQGYTDCKARGGSYVQGAVWYECVASQP